MLPGIIFCRRRTVNRLPYRSQDIILGCYYMTKERGGSAGGGKLFANPQEVRVAYDAGEVGLQARIRVRMQGEVVSTTVGRVLLREILPAEISFDRVNQQLDKGALTALVAESLPTCR